MKKILFLLGLAVSLNSFGQTTLLSCVDTAKGGSITIELKADGDADGKGLVTINGNRMNEGVFTKATITWMETIGDSTFSSVLNRFNGLLHVGIFSKDRPQSMLGTMNYKCSRHQSRMF